jgi:ribonuclease D
MQRPTKEQIREFPLYIGLSLSHIKLVENEADAALAIATLNHEAYLGFDTESKPVFRKGEANPGPTLIQLATQTRAFLFPVRFTCALSAAATILSNENITKIGFGIHGDIKELRNKLNVDIVNTQNLSVELKNIIGDKNTIGARAAVAMVLKQRLGKGAQKSNWGTYPLKSNQIKYAANDAHAAICVAISLGLTRV